MPESRLLHHVTLKFVGQSSRWRRRFSACASTFLAVSSLGAPAPPAPSSSSVVGTSCVPVVLALAAVTAFYGWKYGEANPGGTTDRENRVIKVKSAVALGVAGVASAYWLFCRNGPHPRTPGHEKSSGQAALFGAHPADSLASGNVRRGPRVAPQGISADFEPRPVSAWSRKGSAPGF